MFMNLCTIVLETLIRGLRLEVLQFKRKSKLELLLIGFHTLNLLMKVIMEKDLTLCEAANAVSCGITLSTTSII